MSADSSHYITLLEGRLKAAVELRPAAGADNWLLQVHLMYDGSPAGSVSFNLHDYRRDEAEAVAANIGDNPFLMREIDEFLWGESD